MGSDTRTVACERCGNPAYVSGGRRPLCDSCLDLVYYGVKTYNPAGFGYLTGEDLTDITLGRRSYSEVIATYGFFVSAVTLSIPKNDALPQIIRDCDKESIDWLTRHPDELYKIKSDSFKRIIATIFEADGFEVEFINSWNQSDGGVDLIAVQKIFEFGDIRVAIQCKRHAHTYQVTTEPIYSLNGVLDKYKAHKGVIATTSEFTENAWKEVHDYFWRISLMDYKRILSAMQRLQLTESRMSFSLEEYMKAKSDATAIEQLLYRYEQKEKLGTQKLDSASPITILFLGANPADTTRLRLDKEVRSVDESLQKSKFGRRFELKQQWAVRVADIQGCLLRHKPEIVHFSGHGSVHNEIFLENDLGYSTPVSARALSRLFSLLRGDIRCVILNSCYSKIQAQAIAEHVDCVIGMSGSIGDASSINFSTAFYQALAYGKDVQTAFDLGCLQIDLANLGEQDVPVLVAINNPANKVVLVR